MKHNELEEFINNELDMRYNITPHWHRQANYIVGDKVRFDGAIYKCKKSHISNLRWNPVSEKALWEKVK